MGLAGRQMGTFLILLIVYGISVRVVDLSMVVHLH